MNIENTSAPGPPPKVVVVVREDLLGWQELNVTAFLVSAVVGLRPDLIGEPYRDGDGTAYLPMLGVPVTVLTATGVQLTTMRQKATGRQLPLSIFTADLFKTGNDQDNRAAVARVPTSELDLVGLATVGPRNVVDKVTKGGRLHP